MIALALFAIVVTALAAYSLGHSAGVKLERGRHHLAPTMKTVAAVKEAVDRAAEVGAVIGFACFIVVISIFVMPWVVMLAPFVYEESRTKPWDDFRDEQDHAE